MLGIRINVLGFSGGIDGFCDCESNAKQEFIKVAVLPREVGIWNEGVGGGSDDGVWISADVKHGFSIDWCGDVEEELKEVLKWWGYGSLDWFSFWGWFGKWKCN